MKSLFPVTKLIKEWKKMGMHKSLYPLTPKEAFNIMKTKEDLEKANNIFINTSTLYDNFYISSSENLEKALDKYIEDGLTDVYKLGRGGIEEAHMILGDDKFHMFICNMKLEIDKKGKKYIVSFLEEYEVPDKSEVKRKREKNNLSGPKIIEVLNQKIYNYNSYNTPRFLKDNHVGKNPSPSRVRGKKPKYIVLSNYVHRVLIDHQASQPQSDRISSSFTPHQFRGFPIAIVNTKDIIIDVV